MDNIVAQLPVRTLLDRHKDLARGAEWTRSLVKAQTAGHTEVLPWRLTGIVKNCFNKVWDQECHKN